MDERDGRPTGGHEGDGDDDAIWLRRSRAMAHESFAARLYDAGGDLNASRQAEVKEILAVHGAVHVIHTGLASADDVLVAMPDLGFGPDQQFNGGGRTSRDWQDKWVRPGLRRMDHYPPSLYLLPNNEVQYQRTTPAQVLLFFRRAPVDGGRTFLHSARAVEAGLRAGGAVGVGLLEKLERHGVVIETGFLDRRHPLKAHNTFQSWQERFDTDDDVLALARAGADEACDAAWWLDERDVHDGGRPLRTLMTRILLSAFMTHPRDGRRYLRFPRLALDGPSTRNGHRRFPLGNGEEPTPAERRLLRQVYLDTREGLRLHDGDVILFDNLHFGHSREVFTGEREVLVGMAGCLRNSPNDGPHAAPSAAAATTTTIGRYARPSSSPTRYELPAALLARGTSARVFDANGVLDDATCAAIATAFQRHGAVHVRHTGLTPGPLRDDGVPPAVLVALGFSAEDAFPWGGMASGRTVRTSLSKELRATDDYPPSLWLLPHNEILYQRQVPARLLFTAVDVAGTTSGGRTFVHDALATEDAIRASGDVGVRLLTLLRDNGLLIEMGFIDELHPARATNFFRSWQDRFETTSKDEALRRCLTATHQFDEAWWHDEAFPDLPGGAAVSTLMTRFRVPAFQRSDVDGRDRLLFPRIALDGPAAHNGFRRYTLGDGTPLSDDEVDVLLSAFIATREGIPWQDGDLLLVDNIRFGHSREAFTGRRVIGVAMAGRVDVAAPPPLPGGRS